MARKWDYFRIVTFEEVGVYFRWKIRERERERREREIFPQISLHVSHCSTINRWQCLINSLVDIFQQDWVNLDNGRGCSYPEQRESKDNGLKETFGQELLKKYYTRKGIIRILFCPQKNQLIWFFWPQTIFFYQELTQSWLAKLSIDANPLVNILYNQMSLGSPTTPLRVMSSPGINDTLAPKLISFPENIYYTCRSRSRRRRRRSLPSPTTRI